MLEGLTCKRVQIRLNSSKKELEPRGEEKKQKMQIEGLGCKLNSATVLLMQSRSSTPEYFSKAYIVHF